jgi:type I restriction enzyme S subunit
MVEHLAADCLSIKRWGDLADGNVPPTFYKVFRKGQILYPTRNPHLRRAAFADFDGICGEKTLTLSPRRGFHPKFLAFVFQSGAFIRFATNRRIGSTNPHVRWRDVAEFEFRLPPLDQQRRIAEILSAIDDDVERQVRLSADLQQVVTAKVEEELDELFRGSTEFLSELLLGSPESGCSAPPSPSDTGHFVLSLSALSRTGYVRGNLKPVPPTKAMLACRLAAGDFLISRSNTQELVGFVGIFDEDRDNVSFPDTMMRLPVNENRVSRNFLEAVLQSRRGRLHMMRSAAGTSGSMKKINRRTLGTCLVPNPAVEVQERFLCKTHLLREAENSAIAAQRAGAGMKHAFMESVFG